MFEELYEPVPDTAKFLERIGLSGFVPSIDLSSLNTMIKAYRETIPFENLSVWYERKTPSLATADLYKKMIIGRRGGYCFELNGLFCAFLKTLGFDIYSIAVFVREDVDGLTDLGHRASICTLGRRKYLVEVGYGGSSPDYALPLDGEIIGDFFIREEKNEYTVYKIVDEDKELQKGNGRFLVNRQISVADSDYYNAAIRTVVCKKTEMFRDYVAYPVEFLLPNIAVSKDPDNKFNRNLVVNLKNANGEIYSIENDRFTGRTADGEFERKIADMAELRSILDEYFNIEI